jgi:GMP synthase-like glutamine amidotransferase
MLPPSANGSVITRLIANAVIGSSQSRIALPTIMKFLVFQHIACEHPGIFRHFFDQANIAWDAVELDEGQDIPPFSEYDALWVMGGPMDVWDEVTCPWLIPEKAAIRRWVTETRKPYLGVCLGHQLLADSLGGECAVQKRPEIGILTVNLTPEGESDPLFADIPPEVLCLQWHSVEVCNLPPDSVVLASSSDCRYQAIRVGHNAWGIQFHVELEESTIEDWSGIPAYADALEATLGSGALIQMKDDAKLNYPKFLRNSKQLFQNFLSIVDTTRPAY